MSQVPWREKRNRPAIHVSGGSSHKSRSVGIYTLTPVKTRRGKTTYEEVHWPYYRAFSSEEEDTPRTMKTKMLWGAAGGSNLDNEFAQFIDEDYSGRYKGVVSGRWKTKVKGLLFLIIFSNHIKDSEWFSPWMDSVLSSVSINCIGVGRSHHTREVSSLSTGWWAYPVSFLSNPSYIVWALCCQVPYPSPFSLDPTVDRSILW